MSDVRSKAAVKCQRLSHGTLESNDLALTRRFYEEFLGFETVLTSDRSMMVRHGTYNIVVIKKPNPDYEPSMLAHWGFDLTSIDEVDEAHKTALELQEKYGIKEIRKPRYMHGAYQFYFKDLDGNWWEYQYLGEEGVNDDTPYQRLFSQGDQTGEGYLKFRPGEDE